VRFTHLTLTLPAMLLAALALLPARAANINDLRDQYVGRAHHSSVAGQEDLGITFFFTDTQPNGNFTGSIEGGIPLSGKVTASGAITFSGSTTSEGGPFQIKKGTGQLSATGRFIVGSFQFKGAGVETPGKYTFHVDSEP
jgi:hypothetical protein